MMNRNIDVIAITVLLIGVALFAQAQRTASVRLNPARRVALVTTLRDRVNHLAKVPRCTSQRISQITLSE